MAVDYVKYRIQFAQFSDYIHNFCVSGVFACYAFRNDKDITHDIEIV